MTINKKRFKKIRRDSKRFPQKEETLTDDYK